MGERWERGRKAAKHTAMDRRNGKEDAFGE